MTKQNEESAGRTGVMLGAIEKGGKKGETYGERFENDARKRENAEKEKGAELAKFKGGKRENCLRREGPERSFCEGRKRREHGGGQTIMDKERGGRRDQDSREAEGMVQKPSRD